MEKCTDTAAAQLTNSIFVKHNTRGSHDKEIEKQMNHKQQKVPKNDKKKVNM